MNASLQYDKDLKIMAVAPSIWARSGPAQWFHDYDIISAMNNPVRSRLKVININDYLPDGGMKTSRQILTSEGMEHVRRRYSLEGYLELLYKPRASSNGSVTLGNDKKIADSFENKAWLRQKFNSMLHFPNHQLLSIETMQRQGFEALSRQVNAQALVVQHPSLSGGRGTFYVHNADELNHCITSLLETLPLSASVVVSEKLQNPIERTIQACVTHDDVLVGPAQAQLIGHPVLTSTQQGAIQFCGGRIESQLVTGELYQQIVKAARTVGKQLQEKGYRGIFGMDFLVSNQSLYVLEVNPRLTGLTTLLSFLGQEAPLLLLHILELAHSPYELPSIVDSSRSEAGSFIVVYAQGEGIVDYTTGIYDHVGVRHGDGFENGTIFPDKFDHFFVGMRVESGQRVPEGKSLAFIYSRKQLFNDNGELDETVLPLVRAIQNTKG